MSKVTAKFYNRFSLLYPLVDLFLKPQKRRLLSEVNKLPAGSLLEVGVGNGSHLGWYARHEITAIDNSETMLAKATQKLGSIKDPTSSIDLKLMNAEQLAFADQSFDYAVLSHVIAVVDDPEKLLVEICRVMKPGGKIFILNHFTPRNALSYIDTIFQPFSKLFHFRSVFYIEDLVAIKKFEMVREISFGRAGYFKILIYRRT